MNLDALYTRFLESKGISTDSRKYVEGTLFFALKGDNFDGNNYVTDALKKGCLLAITERTDLEGNSAVHSVPSALEVLQQLAHYHRKRRSPRVLAITGSNGKTTTKELVTSVLSRKFSVHATSGNLNNHIGVPLTLLSMDAEEVAVIEMGANHPGEIRQLAGIVAPHMGIITNVGKAHLEGFGSEQGVLKAKGELFEYLSASGGTAIIDGRDQLLMQKAKETGVAVQEIASHGQIPVSARIINQSPYLEIQLEIDGALFRIATGLVGAYNLQNILLAAGVGFLHGVEDSAIADAIRTYIPQNQRSQFVQGGRNRIILDSYNANPSSMREAISGFLAYASPPTMLILGDMAELGKSSRREHAELTKWIGSLSIDKVLLVGPKFSEVSEPSSGWEIFMKRSDLEEYLKSTRVERNHILVKGSRVMELEKILKLITA